MSVKRTLTLLFNQLAIRLANISVPRFQAPYYGQYLTANVFDYYAFWIVVLFSSYGFITNKKSTSHLLSASVLLLVSPLFMYYTRSFSSTWGPEYGPVLSTIPLLLSNALFATNYGIVKVYGIIILVPSFLLLQQIDINFLHKYLSTCDSLVLSNIIFSMSSALLIYISDSKHATRLKIYVTMVIILSLGSYNLYTLAGISQCTINRPLNQGTLEYTVLEHAESNTGFVSVIDIPSEYGPIRIMRCDHTILGGTYINYGNASIFSAFYHMDFVRYVKREKDYSDISALQIGLGIGVSAKTLLDSGFSVDVAEIDPKLYEYALKYFNLPMPRNAFIGDGRLYVEKHAQNSSYDYVLHDIFTGGYVEPSLFSVEIFSSIKAILKPDGVLAVNYVGHPYSIATKTVVATLKQVFKNVVCYLEVPDESEQNITIFATSFDDDIEFDFTQNDININDETYQSTRKIFSKQARLELDLENISPIFDSLNPLKALQYPSAIAHWKIVRSVFPDSNLWTEHF
ncbi:hypothetical protein HDV06_005548 [Boothiomyces sp. JEL0866]|nr:hypothetical protein HDV06_005548 [Boothiomyces sp. JEL0866]